MPRKSITAPLATAPTANAQKAGLNTSPSCSLEMWNAALNALATSPRIANDIEVVMSDTALTAKRARLFIECAYAFRPRHVQPALAGLEPVRTARLRGAPGRHGRALQRDPSARRARSGSSAARPRLRRRARHRARARHAVDLSER